MTTKAKPKKQLRRAKRPIGTRDPGVWLAVGALAVTTVGGRSQTVPAFDGTKRTAAAAAGTPRPAAARTLPVRRFDLRPGPLADVAEPFRKATGIRVEFSSPELGAISSPGVTGLFGDEQALARLLADTGLRFRFVGPDVCGWS